MTTGQRMRQARERRGKSQLQIAKELGKTQPTVHAWENDHARVRTDELRRTARVYGLRPLDLIPAEGERAA